jgi:peptide deformylase
MSENDFTKCCITHFPAPVLAEPAKPIENTDESIRTLADKMIDIMLENKGIGLAGPQAGVNLRIFVVSLDGTKENARVYINPKIENSGPLVNFEEGCLSLPGVSAKIKRFRQCTITATDLDGNTFTEHAEGLPARAFQHEFDHLDGMLIKDRMTTVQNIAARKSIKKLREDYNEKNET